MLVPVINRPDTWICTMEERALMEGEVLIETDSETNTSDSYGREAETTEGSARSDEVVQRTGSGGELYTGWICEQYNDRETQVVSGLVGSRGSIRSGVTSRLRRVLSSIASRRFKVAIRSPVLVCKV